MTKITSFSTIMVLKKCLIYNNKTKIFINFSHNYKNTNIIFSIMKFKHFSNENYSHFIGTCQTNVVLMPQNAYERNNRLISLNFVCRYIYHCLKTVIVTSTINWGFGRQLSCHQVTNFLELLVLVLNKQNIHLINISSLH